jgi:hypothetical protein
MRASATHGVNSSRAASMRLRRTLMSDSLRDSNRAARSPADAPPLRTHRHTQARPGDHLHTHTAVHRHLRQVQGQRSPQANVQSAHPCDQSPSSLHTSRRHAARSDAHAHTHARQTQACTPPQTHTDIYKHTRPLTRAAATAAPARNAARAPARAHTHTCWLPAGVRSPPVPTQPRRRRRRCSRRRLG